MYPTVSLNNTSFKGHCGCEIIKCGKERILLTTESAFGREFEDLDYAVKHVNKNFPKLKEKRFVVGACSTGEEVWTLKMLMGENPVKILGFDIAPKALDIAKNATYTFFSPNTRKVRLFKNDDGYQDLFLAYSKPHNVKEKRLFDMFHNMFEIIKFPKFSIFISDKKIYKLKEFQPDCKFIKGDIKNLPPEINEKCQIFSFRNAFYHLLTYHDGCGRDARSTKVLKPMLDGIFKSVNKTMDKGAVFILGKNENTQCENIKLVTKALLNNGFKPLKHNEKFCNLWEKSKEV